MLYRIITIVVLTLFLPDVIPGVGGTSDKTPADRKIVLIAGPKSHGPGEHEYIKSVRLIKTLLDNSNVKGIRTEIHLDGWPIDESTLNDADLILFTSDGRDGELYANVPFMQPGRIEVIEKQMKRGCGLSLLHFSTFASDDYGAKVLEWGGGYFDWQDDEGKRNWYSSIKTIKAEVQIVRAGSPVSNGVKPFVINEEFYYNIRFKTQDKRVKPVLQVSDLKGNSTNGNVVAWTIERQDGGRGFCTTMGHYFSNWEQADYRKLQLNGIVWAAGAKVPANGVETVFYSDKQVTEHLSGKKRKALILTGNHHPMHPWQKTTPLIRKSIAESGNFFVDVSTNIEDLAQYQLTDYDLLVMNYCNWEDPRQLSERSKTSFVDYLEKGGGLIIIHFANGAFHKSLPGAGSSDWPEYRKICRRIWDHDSNSSHDPYGTFTVKISPLAHPATAGIKDFNTTDELYFNQKGDEPVVPLITARSQKTGKEEPLAWAYNYGKGRIFQTLLGHNEKSIEASEVKQLLGQAAIWCATKTDSKE